MENPEFILIMIAAAAVGRFLLAKARARGKAWEAGLEALCDRQGWLLGVVDPSRGPRSGTAIRSSKESWMLSFHRIGSGVSGSTSSMRSGDRWTVWRDPAFALDEGLAVLGPAIPARTLEKTQAMLEKEGLMSRVMLDAFIKGLDPKHALKLRVVADRFDPEQATLLATPGNERVFDFLLESDTLDVLAVFEGRIGDRPSLILDQEGLMFRVERTMKDHEEITRFIDAGRSISRALAIASRSSEVA